jgi:restriction system protein
MDINSILSLFLTKLLPVFIFIAFFKLFIDIILPRLIKKYKNEKRFKEGGKWRSDRDVIYWLRGMSPTDFENYISELFRNMGFKTEVVGKAYDGGVDVIAEKNGVKHYIQCKKYITSTVGVSEVRDFYGAVADRLAQGKGYFITTNKFTLESEKFTEDKPIELVDEFKLLKFIKLAKKDGNISLNKQRNKIPAQKCQSCGDDLIIRKGKFGNFFGCSNYPKCKFTQKIKK